MKKLLVIGLALSTMAFAKGNFNGNNDGFGKGQGQNQGNQMNQMQNVTLTEAQQKELATIRETHQKAMAPLMLSIQEKDLAIKKELLADKVNWTKVESLTKEKSDIEAKMEVQMLKNQVEIKEKFGINVGGFGMGMKGNGKGMKK
jgi:Spy/CpxP family protein refolding chaperone